MTNNNLPDKEASAAQDDGIQARLDAALARHQQGDLDGAQILYREILAAVPEHPDALHLLGLVAAQQGRLDDAAVLMRRSLAANGDNAAAHVNLGNVLGMTGHPGEALDSYTRAIGIAPEYTEAYCNRGNVLKDLGRHPEALEDYDRAIALWPDYPEAHYNRGVLLQGIGRREDALAGYRRAIEVRPGYADAYNNSGVLLQDMRRFDEALSMLKQAIALNPQYAGAFNNQGNVLRDLGRYGEAVRSYESAIRLQPDFAEAWNNLGVALQNLQRWDEALASYARAVRLRPDYADAHRNDGLCRLLIGDFAEGWSRYEWRWRTTQFGGRQPALPRWDGKPVDRGLLVRGEQGLGDQIFYAGMLPDLVRRAGHLSVCVEPRLVSLFARSFPDMTIVPDRDAVAGRDCVAEIPIGSIGGHLRRSWADFPKVKPAYLRADPLRSAGLRESLAAGGRLVCGLSWISRNEAIGSDKSIGLQDLMPLLDLRNVLFVDLQYGDTRATREALAAETGVKLVHVDAIDNHADIDGLAALIGACDVIVTVSNTTAHLAAALGRKVYLLLPFSQGLLWYWHHGRTDSPWYADVRLFRQDAPGDWRDAVMQVGAAVAALGGETGAAGRTRPR